MDRQELLSDFLNSFLGHHSEEHGCYYGSWEGDVVTLVDSNKIKCSNNTIYQLVQPRLKDYGYMLNDDLEIVEQL